MSETALRWKGRFASLKYVAVVVLIVAVLLLILAAGSLRTAVTNPAEPQEVKISRLVSGEVGLDRYVIASGLTNYFAAYQRTEDDTVKDDYYFLYTADGEFAVLVEAPRPGGEKPSFEPATVTGLTRGTPLKLKELVDSDIPTIRADGTEITSTLYIAEGEKPASLGASLGAVIGLSVLVIISLASIFTPSTVFSPQPMEPVTQPATGDAGVKATGRFLRLKSVQPPEIGRGWRNFQNAVANLVPLADGRLMVYSHHVMTTRAYGVKVSQRESDWALFFGQNNVVAIEAGKVYAWRDRPAVRLRYREEGGRERVLTVSFNHAAAQADFVDMLRKLGFAVS